MFVFGLVVFGLSGKKVLATKLGTVDCGMWNKFSQTCENCNSSVSCDVGCASCDCGSNCPYVPPPCVSNGICSEPCGGGVDNCGVSCNNHPCCTPTNPQKPVLVSPDVGVQLRVGQSSQLSWNAISSWGTGCDSNVNRYEVCVMSDATCNLVNNVSTGLGTTYNWTPTLADSLVTWKVRSNNNSRSVYSDPRTVCVEGGPVYGTWSACDANHKRTRTCTEACGADDCTAVGAVAGIVTEDCTGVISGALFDASDWSFCPGDIVTNPANYRDILIANRSFSMTGPYSLPAWPPSSDEVVKTVATNGNGVYSVTAFSPGVYNYDFSALDGTYTDVNNPKLVCTGFPTATLLGSAPSCLVQPCTPASTGNSFGFWRVYGGWWQVVGGSVYAKNGITSSIPASISPSADQQLILSDANGRSGLLTYGVPWVGTELGSNPNAVVSESGRRMESMYDGLRYDYNLYNTRMDSFISTPWDGGAVNYDDQGRGYQIFKHSGNVTLNYSGPTGSEKVILLVNGNVTVNSNIVVPDGAFFSIIAKGNILFDPSVTQAHGWFVGETINVPCHDGNNDGTCDKDDAQFVGEGSFVGWTNISLGRDMNTNNNFLATEKFIYRPDMFINAAEPMKVYTKKFSPFVP